MANFLEPIFAQLQRADERVVLREIHGETFTTITGRELLAQVQRGRSYVSKFGLVPGNRCGLLGANSIQWVAVDLALMAEGIIVVPLYSRQAAGELASMMKDSSPSLLIVGDTELGAAIEREWPARPHRVLMEEVLRAAPARAPVTEVLNARMDGDLVAIIYTSGTSGEPKGVCLNVGNVAHMLRCISERLDQLMGASSGQGEPGKMFHYLPFNFAGSWILQLSCLLRESVLTLSTDLNKLAEEIRLSAPNYFLNVPTLLERVRRGVLDSISKRAAPIRMLFKNSKASWEREHSGARLNPLDAIWLAIGRRPIFPKGKERFGGNLRALICGSPALAG